LLILEVHKININQEAPVAFMHTFEMYDKSGIKIVEDIIKLNLKSRS
jgi:hypothetical protein